MCDLPCRFQRGEQKEVGIVREGDVLLALAFEDPKLDHWRRVYWTAICRCCSVLA